MRCSLLLACYGLNFKKLMVHVQYVVKYSNMIDMAQRNKNIHETSLMCEIIQIFDYLLIQHVNNLVLITKCYS